MSLRTHVIQQGEYLQQLAHRFGFVAEDVWGHERNAELRARRPNPAMLAPGDCLVIPVIEREGLPLQLGTANRYQAIIPTAAIEIVLRDRANERYVIEGLPAGDQEGVTDAGGVVRFRAPISVSEVTIQLVDRDVSHHVRIGHLDPIEEDSGVRQRLRHLGYLGHRGGLALSDDSYRRAIASFQTDSDLEATGSLDATTRQKLLEVHGG